MDKDLLKIPASIDKVETMADKTLKLLVYTSRELTPEDETKIMRFRNQEGYMIFSPEDFNIEDIEDLPEEKPEFKNQKTPSERLRNVLFVFYTQTHEWKEDQEHRKKFDIWRADQMEKFINLIKSKLKQ